jgi:hypothetical protein
MFDLGPDLPDNTLVEMVRIPTRIRNAIQYAGLKTIGDLRDTTDNRSLVSQIWDLDRSNGYARGFARARWLENDAA